MIESTCPRCGRVHHSDDEHRGRYLRCAGCGDAVHIGETSSQRDAISVGHSVDVKLPRSLASFASVLSNRWLAATVVIFAVGCTMFWAGRRSIVRPEHVSVNEIPSAWAANAASPGVGTTTEGGSWQDYPSTAGVAPIAAGKGPASPVRLDTGEYENAPDSEGSAKLAREPPSPSDKPRDIFDSAASCVGIDCDAPEPPPANRHATGDDLAGTAGSGHGKLTLTCSGDLDSVVRVIDESSGDEVRRIYVRAHDTIDISGIAPGQYSVLVMQGRIYQDAEQQFERDAAYFRFPHSYKFGEEEVGNRLRYDHISLTLNEVPDGNVRVVHINRQEFWSGARRPQVERSPGQ